MLQLEQPWVHEHIQGYASSIVHISQGLIRKTEAILGSLSRKRLIHGIRGFETHWRGWERKGQEDTRSEGMEREVPPMIPGASRTKAGGRQEDTCSCWKLSPRMSAA